MTNIIQTSAAVYVLVIATAVIFTFLRSVATGKQPTATLKGFPLIVAFVAIVICAVTVLAEAI